MSFLSRLLGVDSGERLVRNDITPRATRSVATPASADPRLMHATRSASSLPTPRPVLSR